MCKLPKYDYIVSYLIPEHRERIESVLRAVHGKQLNILSISPENASLEQFSIRPILAGRHGYKQEQLLGIFTNTEIMQLLE